VIVCSEFVAQWAPLSTAAFADKNTRSLPSGLHMKKKDIVYIRCLVRKMDLQQIYHASQVESRLSLECANAMQSPSHL
jgi:hypothetical protein